MLGKSNTTLQHSASRRKRVNSPRVNSPRTTLSFYVNQVGSICIHRDGLRKLSIELGVSPRELERVMRDLADCGRLARRGETLHFVSEVRP